MCRFRKLKKRPCCATMQSQSQFLGAENEKSSEIKNIFPCGIGGNGVPYYRYGNRVPSADTAHSAAVYFACDFAFAIAGEPHGISYRRGKRSALRRGLLVFPPLCVSRICGAFFLYNTTCNVFFVEKEACGQCNGVPQTETAAACGGRGRIYSCGRGCVCRAFGGGFILPIF